MTAQELAEATKAYDRPQVFPEAPVPRTELAKHEKAGRKRGRPRVGAGAVRVFISVDLDLLQRIDTFAKARGMTRSALLALGAELYMAREASNGGAATRHSKSRHAAGGRVPIRA